MEGNKIENRKTMGKNINKIRNEYFLKDNKIDKLPTSD